MPQINLLLSDSSKKKKAKPVEAGFAELARIKSIFFPVLDVAIASLLLIWLVISFFVLKDKRELSLLEKRRSKLTASPQEISSIKLKKDELQEKVSLLMGLVSREFLWADKLNELAGFLPDGLWFTEIYLSKASTAAKAKSKTQDVLPERLALFIKGKAFAYKIQDAVGLIGNFNDLMKEDEEFSRDFSEIKLSNVAKSSIAKTDVMNFEFNLQLH